MSTVESTIGWNFRYMHEEESCPFRCTYEELGNYLSRMKDYEGKTKSEIGCGRDSNHAWKDTNRLNKIMKNLIRDTPILTDKIIYQIELSGKCRAFGFYTGNIFNFVFLDKEHQAYRCSKK